MREDGGRRALRVAPTLWLATGVVSVAGIVLTAIAWSNVSASDSYANVGCGIAAVVYATLGLLIVRRVGNSIGWLLLGCGLALAFVCAGSAYAIAGVLTHPGAFPAAKLVGLFAEWAFVPSIATLTFMLLLFPTGTLPSPRWRPVAIVGIGATVLALVGFVVHPRVVALPAPGGISLTYPNPLGVRTLGPVLSTVLIGTLDALTTVSVAVLAAGFAALVVRYRRGGLEVRQQVKWVALVAAGFVVGQAVALIALAACGCTDTVVIAVANAATAVLALLGIPAAIAVAILKYRLYDIDVIINRAVVYGLLAGAVTAVYTVIVVGIGTLGGYTDRPVLTTTAAVAIALLFQPLRRQAQRLANRVVYGDRATPYEVLSQFAENMAGTLGVDEVLDRMVAVLAAGTAARHVDVWIRVGTELRPVATWPRGATVPESTPLQSDGALPAFDEVTRSVAVRQGNELLGAIALRKPRNEALSPTEDKLLRDLAAQAGLVLRNVRLTEELRANVEQLRASRRRLVEAQDAERRRLERNLHDGAQQQLVALSVQLGLLERLAEDPERVRQVSGQLRGAVQDALDDLRDLARGIYPPLLADKGLAVALETQARKAAVPTTVDSDGVGRYPQDVEAAVYFCTLEAMQNVAKYAEATAVVVRLAERDGSLVFEIEDDGRGFDQAGTGYGTGLQGMADRLDAIGGAIEVKSIPGRGTLIRGSIRLA